MVLRIFFPLSLCLGLFLFSAGGYSESSEVFKKEQDLVRIEMVQLSRELGVTCTECHSSKNWRDDSKGTFKVAREHLKIVEVLRGNGFDGKKGPEASCFMCHQGHLKFAFKMQHPEGATMPMNSAPVSTK